MDHYPFKVIFENWHFIGSGLITTLEISLLALSFSLVIGIVFGVLGVVPNRVLRGIYRAYVESFRNVPPLVHLYFIYFALPHVGITLGSFVSGVIGLTAYHAAFVAEIIRAGINAVGRAQLEGARAVGFSYLQAMQYVILKQAIWIVLPPLGNLFISLIKTSSLVATIATADLMYEAQILNERTFRTFEVFTFAGLVYISICLVLSVLISRLENRIPSRSS